MLACAQCQAARPCRHKVVGVFMHNWDAGEEGGGPGGCSEADLAAAQCVAAQLRIPLLEADFTQQYWHSVFADFVAQVRGACAHALTVRGSRVLLVPAMPVACCTPSSLRQKRVESLVCKALPNVSVLRRQARLSDRIAGYSPVCLIAFIQHINAVLRTSFQSQNQLALQKQATPRL